MSRGTDDVDDGDDVGMEKEGLEKKRATAFRVAWMGGGYKEEEKGQATQPQSGLRREKAERERNGSVGLHLAHPRHKGRCKGQGYKKHGPQFRNRRQTRQEQEGTGGERLPSHTNTRPHLLAHWAGHAGRTKDWLRVVQSVQRAAVVQQSAPVHTQTCTHLQKPKNPQTCR